MKKLILLLALLPLTSFAKPAATTTDISIKPWWPAYCEKHDYPMVNQVSEVEKIHEDEKQAIFGFKTTIGQCSQQLFEVTSQIWPQATTSVMRNKVVLFQKPAVTAETQVVSPNTAYVKLTFNKSVTFKHVDTVSFGMNFYPHGVIQPRFVQNGFGGGYWYYPRDAVFFPWTVDVTKVSASETSARVRLN